MMSIKHGLTVLVFLFFGVAGYCQTAERSTVSGQLNFVEKDKRILQVTYRKIGGGYQFDSAAVINGQFKFDKEISEPVIVIMSIRALPGAPRANQGGMDYLSLLLMPGGNLTINAPSSLESASISGTGAAENQEYQAYSKQVNLYIDKMNQVLRSSINTTMDSVGKEQRITAIQDSMNLIRDQQVYLKFATSKSQSPVGAIALLSYAAEPVWRPRKKLSPEEIEKLLARLPKKTLSYSSLKNLKEELAVSKATGYGKPIIDFSLEDTSGKMVRLSDFKGKYVFLDFWASWCVPCRKENPNVKKQFEKYKDKGFTVVSVSLDKPNARQAWIDAIQKDKVGLWTHLGDLNGFEGKVAKSYYVKSIPTNFLIGPDGKFLGRNLYGEQLDKELAKVFSN